MIFAVTSYDDGDCDFDRDYFCSWTQSYNDTFNWSRQSGPTSSSATGPSYDHTTGNCKLHLSSNNINPFRFRFAPTFTYMEQSDSIGGRRNLTTGIIRASYIYDVELVLIVFLKLYLPHVCLSFIFN